MKASYLNYQDTKSFPPGLLRFLAQEPDLRSFYAEPATIEGFKQKIAQKTVKADRQTLVKVLQEQYGRLRSEPAAAVIENINSLARHNTYTITTGHQLNLFTGPLYFIYKIATAIKLTQELKATFPDQHFVPVYWMATEDHDFAEINHTHIAGKKIAWEKEAAGATGRLNTDELAATLKAYQNILGASPDALRLSAWTEEAYLKHENLADATRYLVNKLFEAYGLVILDADQPELKRQFSAVIEADITQQNSFGGITETIGELKKLGIDVPVNPREINFFYLKEALRERITFENENFKVLNTSISFTGEELAKEIKEHPENFSPNVVMRPLYQETILPNLAYIGGGAEILYWLELKSTFDHYQLNFPILVLRNSAQLLSEQQTHQLERLNIGATDLFKPLNELKKSWILRHSAKNLDLKTSLPKLQETFEEIKHQAKEIDTTLVDSTTAVQVRLEKALHNLEKKFIKAEKRNHEEAMAQLEKIHSAFFPQGGLQERSQNFGLYFSQYGDEFIQNLITAFHPLEFKFTLLSTKE